MTNIKLSPIDKSGDIIIIRQFNWSNQRDDKECAHKAQISNWSENNSVALSFDLTFLE